MSRGDGLVNKNNSDDVLVALEAHDKALRDRGLAIWLGGEPTFTDRFSNEAGWNGAAEGEGKRQCGARMAAELHRARPGSVLFRAMGRQYPEEAQPRWCYGVYALRSGDPIYRGPPDPWAGGRPSSEAQVLLFADAMAERLGGERFQRNVALGERFACVPAGARLDHHAEALSRLPFGSEATSADGPRDELAEIGILLGCVGLDEGVLRIDMPAFADVDELARWLDAASDAAQAADVGGLIVSGFQPPVDQSVWFATFTPDPGVLEVNAAPEPCVADYYASLKQAFALAEAEGLAAERFFFNGDCAGSGGGGHLTFGGPTPAESPFFREPRLLPRMLAFFHRHPSLSYLFAPEGVGSSGQFPRADEVTLESFDELRLAVRAIGSAPIEPATLWETFAPLLADRFGNRHRSELNIEKLWNPHLPWRGKLGLVELRALRMLETPEAGAAVAALLRAVCATCATSDIDLELPGFGADLHDRFALPSVLQRDLGAVLREIEAAGFGLAPVLTRLVEQAADRSLFAIEHEAVTLRLSRAFEYWPLIGDLSQEQQTSRLVDASGGRLELSIEGEDASQWQLSVDGYRAPKAMLSDAHAVCGIRYRRFSPQPGLHPTLAARPVLRLELQADGREPLAIEVHDWKPGGGVYDGQPADRAEADRRLAERIVVSRPASPPPAHEAPSFARTDYTLDTRRLPSR